MSPMYTASQRSLVHIFFERHERVTFMSCSSLWPRHRFLSRTRNVPNLFRREAGSTILMALGYGLNMSGLTCTESRPQIAVGRCRLLLFDLFVYMWYVLLLPGCGASFPIRTAALASGADRSVSKLASHLLRSGMLSCIPQSFV